MAIYKETWTSMDELDYRLRSTSLASNITKADANRGVAAVLDQPALANDARPSAAKSSVANERIIGAITTVGNTGCKIVSRGRFVLQAASEYVAADFGKVVNSTTTAGKVEAGAAAGGAQIGAFVIIGGGNDTDEGGIGHYYLVERR